MPVRNGHGKAKGIPHPEVDVARLPPGQLWQGMGVDPPTPGAGREARISENIKGGVASPQVFSAEINPENPGPEIASPSASASASASKPLTARKQAAHRLSVSLIETVKIQPTREDFVRWGKSGGIAATRKARMVEMLGFKEYPEDDPYFPYWKLAQEFRRAEMARLAERVGAGLIGPGPSAIVASAARQLAASIWYTDQGNHLDASRLANDARQNLLAAHELCARQAPKAGGPGKVFDS